jgi:hypothetical protein
MGAAADVIHDQSPALTVTRYNATPPGNRDSAGRDSFRLAELICGLLCCRPSASLDQTRQNVCQIDSSEERQMGKVFVLGLAIIVATLIGMAVFVIQL